MGLYHRNGFVFGDSDLQVNVYFSKTLWFCLVVRVSAKHVRKKVTSESSNCRNNNKGIIFKTVGQ